MARQVVESTPPEKRTTAAVVGPASVTSAHRVEVTDCVPGTMEASAGGGPPSAWRVSTHSSVVCWSPRVRVKLPAGRLGAGQFSVDEPEQAAAAKAAIVRAMV